MYKYVIVALVFIAGSYFLFFKGKPVGSQSVIDNQAVVTGTAPTTNTDGSALTDLTSIKIYHRLDAASYAVRSTIPFTAVGTQFSYTDPNLTDGVHCYSATAVNAAGNESALSNEACKTINTKLPSAPTGVQAK